MDPTEWEDNLIITHMKEREGLIHLNHALLLLNKLEYFKGTLSYPDLQIVLEAFYSSKELYLNMGSDRMYLVEFITKIEAKIKKP